MTYNKLVANGADVVIINDSAGGSQQWSNAEINALQAYLNDGHVVIATFATFVSGGTDNRGLAPLFGLRSDLGYATPGVSPTYTVTGLQGSLFHALGNTYTSSGFASSQVDTGDGIWTAADLNGATIVAHTQDNVAVVTYYNPGPYRAVYISNMPEFGGGAQDKQFIYNAIVNLLTAPSASEFSKALLPETGTAGESTPQRPQPTGPTNPPRNP